MDKKYIGQIDKKLIFAQLPEVKDPIAKGLDIDSDIVGDFLSEWNSLTSAKSLLQYLYIIKNEDDSHEEYGELERFGIVSEFSNNRISFVEKGVIVTSKLGESDVILLDTVISIVDFWCKYLTIAKGRDVIFYGGRFFYNKETIDGIR